ncbi:MAG: hypothetical protein II680_13355, partial [Clostridia bacterium]|nr:hypothetical protein [Clostridia bacterium]
MIALFPCGRLIDPRTHENRKASFSGEAFFFCLFRFMGLRTSFAGGEPPRARGELTFGKLAVARMQLFRVSPHSNEGAAGL